MRAWATRLASAPKDADGNAGAVQAPASGEQRGQAQGGAAQQQYEQQAAGKEDAGAPPAQAAHAPSQVDQLLARGV